MWIDALIYPSKNAAEIGTPAGTYSHSEHIDGLAKLYFKGGKSETIIEFSPVFISISDLTYDDYAFARPNYHTELEKSQSQENFEKLRMELSKNIGVGNKLRDLQGYVIEVSPVIIRFVTLAVPKITIVENLLRNNHAH